MEAQLNELIELAAENGWSSARADNFDAHDWSVETWELESLWSPIGVKAYVTFPIDEQDYRTRKPWAIRVTAEPPAHCQSSESHFQTSLIQWKHEKLRFVEFLDRIRVSKATQLSR